MKAEIISIGTEILLGEIVDTNSQYLAARLPSLGIDLYYTSTVGDNLRRIVEVIGRAWGRSDLVLITGGLGPTEDDLTREGIAAVLQEELRIDKESEARLRQFFASYGTQMPESNVKQAALIPSARAIPNPRGTAPGWWVEREGKIVIALPGPPAEMNRMWEKEVAPELERRRPAAVLITRTLKTSGLAEAIVAERVKPLFQSANPTVGIYARIDGIHLRFGAKAATAEEAQRLIEPLEAEARRLLGEAVWGVDDETLESVIGLALLERGLTLASMESCTGGLLADAITNVPGSSRYFRGGLITYATEAKIGFGVEASVIEEHGVISAECAQAMAEAARERLEADIGLGVTGVVGPESQEGKPLGTIHIGLAIKDGSPHSFSYTYDQGRAANKRRAVSAALFFLRWTPLERQ